jgi:hypothetical protein
VFDSAPILRRLNANGDENYDFLARQASLTLKQNGVYCLRGSEEAARALSTTREKLPWQFTYVVDDRRADASSGRVLPGEKTLTPLAFSCTPALLHPLQAKKVTVMHVFKKAVAPRHTADKLELPYLSKAQQVSTLVVPAPFQDISNTAHSLRSITHRRATSDADVSSENTPLLPSPGHPVGHQQVATKHRRASSSTEGSSFHALRISCGYDSEMTRRSSTGYGSNHGL